MRQTVLAFGVAAVLICGAGLSLRAIWEASGRHAMFWPAVFVAAALLVALWIRSPRRARTGPVEEPSLPVRPEFSAADIDELPEPAMNSSYEPEAGAVAGPSDFAAMDPAAFEVAIGELCERAGCVDIEVTGGAGDLGADVLATAPDGRRMVIQCKRYGPANKVGSQDMQRFGGTCFSVHEAQIAAVVTTGEFTAPAQEYAEQCGIVCIDHDALMAWADGIGPAPWEIPSGEATAGIRPCSPEAAAK
ncbi:restriction endonuclease [Streptomyces sp. NBC_00690]|uniref:restriction endonuclease n=1 Tax=Streptomyces sp. NBC_00690 TaxID=2975808 RepID=UPI002E2B1841|nr:restriction endonuclease [Streptomyces sp. NBC_00690]